MTVQTLGASRRYSGLSSDLKPTNGYPTTSTRVPAGATFYETDSGRTFFYDSDDWLPMPDAATNETIVTLLEENNALLRGIRLGLTQLSGVDLTDVP